ncbi:SDR family oxidoreductase [Leifsonia kafniensis]|uniref:SDR family oxidoreductase n=1 Tax=Leifsonia kafniensis TaxID=475957 RepID=A0ABP7L2P0_9MICO
MTTFLVTGATGRLGGAALRGLHSHVSSSDIRVLARTDHDAARLSMNGVAAHRADYSEPATLRDAFVGVDRLLFVSSPILDPVVRSSQHRAVIEAAIVADVGHVVYTSAMGAPHDPGHTTAETALGASGLGHTILRNGLYTDPFVARAIEDSRTGAVRSASAGGSIVTTSIADLAAAAVTALIDPPSKVMWELRGPAWTFDEMASTLSRLTHQPIRHELVTDAETGAFSVLFPLIRRGVFSAETADLSELLTREPQGIEAVVAEQLRSRG